MPDSSLTRSWPDGQYKDHLIPADTIRGGELLYCLIEGFQNGRLQGIILFDANNTILVNTMP